MNDRILNAGDELKRRSPTTNSDVLRQARETLETLRRLGVSSTTGPSEAIRPFNRPYYRSGRDGSDLWNR